MVTIELFGVPRLRAGRDALDVKAATLGEAFRALASGCPALEPAVVEDGKLKPFYTVALNGAVVPSDPATPLADGDIVILLSADAGG
ncbi:MAG TPA: MoaD/ThiS family protein [Polyangiaceae bacterium]|nr:MoaD/ThiS family protein [Polyangiaceae bacterium]